MIIFNEKEKDETDDQQTDATFTRILHVVYVYTRLCPSILVFAYVYFYLHPQADKLTSPNELFL